jgi:hypothetical protein
LSKKKIILKDEVHDIFFNFQSSLLGIADVSGSNLICAYPELSDSDAEKSQGFIHGAPQGFPSLNDFGAFQGDFAKDVQVNQASAGTVVTQNN